jgi:hypothetical protein
MDSPGSGFFDLIDTVKRPASVRRPARKPQQSLQFAITLTFIILIIFHHSFSFLNQRL